MAYITSEQVKEKRDLIKKAFPAKDGWKWSVTKENYSSIHINLMQYPDDYDFGDDNYNVNHYYIKDSESLGEREKKVFEKINEIAHIGHWDKSDIMTDYFHCAFYVNLGVGKWDKPVKSVPSKKPIAEVAKEKLETFYFDMVKNKGYDAGYVLKLMYS